MNKKATHQRANSLSSVRRKRSIVSSAPSVESSQPESREATFGHDVLAEASQVFSSEEQAITFLLNSIAEKIGGAGPEKAQMHEFLSLLLDSDPGLREEILSGITIRK